MKTVYFQLFINPEPWATGTISWKMQGGKRIPFMGANPQLVNYQNAIRQELAGKTELVSSPCELAFYFWRRLDQYQTQSSKGHARHIADATNLQKALEDALQGVLVTNDKLVRRITSEVVEQSIETDPGILIAIKTEYRPSWANEIPESVVDSFYNARTYKNIFDLDNEI